eukprot:CAMPEP_0181257122 /NCGR_PEP_ID=MMETSP1096-20121128/50077_1 /TAXON_ID=156174 ORGANISM="Chrysochromulina ericina, Strain CCMP281" /NCGR_SAMPLE_ID=MMETSP1096 /ASSEMBLY_ACC=CAM_ASM_000453 /LENGTH=104 /DNA_ID=CAMNT_0023355421 /DNA_START=387 /DNA_END=701 /DNA_ORIENTATION=+
MNALDTRSTEASSYPLICCKSRHECTRHPRYRGILVPPHMHMHTINVRTHRRTPTSTCTRSSLLQPRMAAGVLFTVYAFGAPPRLRPATKHGKRVGLGVQDPLV